MPTVSIIRSFPLVFRFNASRLAVLAAVAFAGPALAGGPDNVPFKASMATQETLRPDGVTCPEQPYVVGMTTGTGTASHLGAVALVASDCISPGLNAFTFSNGHLTFTAANGDELRATYNGNLQPLSGSPPFSLYSISGTITFEGGTGRFTSASGSGYLQGTENIQTGQGQFNVKATLSY